MAIYKVGKKICRNRQWKFYNDTNEPPVPPGPGPEPEIRSDFRFLSYYDDVVDTGSQYYNTAKSVIGEDFDRIHKDYDPNSSIRHTEVGDIPLYSYRNGLMPTIKNISPTFTVDFFTDEMNLIFSLQYHGLNENTLGQLNMPYQFKIYKDNGMKYFELYCDDAYDNYDTDFMVIANIHYYQYGSWHDTINYRQNVKIPIDDKVNHFAIQCDAGTKRITISVDGKTIVYFDIGKEYIGYDIFNIGANYSLNITNKAYTYNNTVGQCACRNKIVWPEAMKPVPEDFDVPTVKYKNTLVSRLPAKEHEYDMTVYDRITVRSSTASIGGRVYDTTIINDAIEFVQGYIYYPYQNSKEHDGISYYNFKETKNVIYTLNHSSGETEWLSTDYVTTPLRLLLTGKYAEPGVKRSADDVIWSVCNGEGSIDPFNLNHYPAGCFYGDDFYGNLYLSWLFRWFNIEGLMTYYPLNYMEDYQAEYDNLILYRCPLTLFRLL